MRGRQPAPRGAGRGEEGEHRGGRVRGRRGGSPPRGFEAFPLKPRRVVVPISQMRSLRLGVVTLPRSCSRSDFHCRLVCLPAAWTNLEAISGFPHPPPHKPWGWPWEEGGPGALCWKMPPPTPHFCKGEAGAWSSSSVASYLARVAKVYSKPLPQLGGHMGGWHAPPKEPCLGLLPPAIEGSLPRGPCCAQKVRSPVMSGCQAACPYGRKFGNGQSARSR